MKEKNGEHPFGDAGQLIMLCLYLIIWAGDSFFINISTFLSDKIPLYVRISILILALIIAFMLFTSAHGIVSHGQRPAGIISTGAFKYVRHPLYLGCILFYLGLAACTASLFSFGLLLVIFVFYNYIAGYEENLLEEKFGDGYLEYRQKTGKWLPGIGKSI
jgi:protein-S-isoprenylcysteine O-methyltransferase Ste14